MMVKKQYFFRCRATPRETSSEPLPHTRIPIKAKLFTLSGEFIGRGDIIYKAPQLVVEQQMVVPLSHLKNPFQIERGDTKMMAGYLSGMGIPEDEQLAIITKVFEAAPHGSPISAIIVDVTVTSRTSELADHQVTIDEDTWEFMETYTTAQSMGTLAFLTKKLRQLNTKMLEDVAYYENELDVILSTYSDV